MTTAASLAELLLCERCECGDGWELCELWEWWDSGSLLFRRLFTAVTSDVRARATTTA